MKYFLLPSFWSRFSSSSSSSSSLVATVSVVLFLHLQQSRPRLPFLNNISGLLVLLHRVNGGYITSKFIIPRSLQQDQIPFVPNYSLRHITTKQKNRYNYRRFVTTVTEVEDQDQQQPWRTSLPNPANCYTSEDDNDDQPLLLGIMQSNIIAPATNVSVDVVQEQQQQPILWTVCNKCQGEGRMYQRSRKARRVKKELPDGPRSEVDLGRPNPQGNVSITLCKFCQGSGLIQQSSSLSSPSDVTSSTDSQKRRPIHIAIIGGGIGGLAFAVACQHRNIHVTVYERDTHFTQRKQGYGLTLQQASKQLMGLGIIPENLTSATSSGITSTKHIVHDEKGNVKGTWGLRHWLGDDTTSNNSNIAKKGAPIQPLVFKNDMSQSTPIKSENVDAIDDIEITQPKKQVQNRRRQNIHIARQALRYELYLAATANERARSNGQSNTDQKHSIIQWNHRLVKYDEMEDGVELTFAVSGENESTIPDSITVHADIVVGADGIRSQVRQQFFGSEESAQLRYLNCIVILGICPLSELEANVKQSTSYGHLIDGETVFQTADGITRIYMMPYSKSEYMWQLSFPIAESDAKDLSARGSVALRNIALSRCCMWHSPIPDILKCTPVDLITGYPVYDRDLVQPHQLQRHNHPHSRRITFIGDAIHCMSPFKGQGANQALLDAVSLARYLNKAIHTAEKQPLDKAENTHCYDDVVNTKKQKFEANELKCQLTGNEIEKVLENYEHEMLSRTAVKVKASADAAHFLHTDIAIKEGDITRGTAAAIAEENLGIKKTLTTHDVDC